MIHRISDDPSNHHGMFGRERTPILTVDAGDTVIANTLSAFWESQPPLDDHSLPPRVKIADRPDPEHDDGMCLVGPIAIRGAKPGQMLGVSIDGMKPGNFGVAVVGGDDWLPKLGLDTEISVMSWQFDEASHSATNLQGHRIQTNPFLGCMGIAPATVDYCSNRIPRPGGGNLDCKDLTVGTVLYLPIEVDGGLFSFGDGHAAQGDGESCGSAIECPMQDVQLTLTLHDDLPLKWPAAKTPAGWLTFGCHDDLREAALPEHGDDHRLRAVHDPGVDLVAILVVLGE
jgi:acetamidase/formamidase